MTVLLIAAGIIITVAGVVLVAVLLPVVSEIRRTIFLGSETLRDLALQREALYAELNQVRCNVGLLSEGTAEWPKVLLLPAEITHLTRSTRVLMKASAFFTVVRQSPWLQPNGFQVRKLLKHIIQGG